MVKAIGSVIFYRVLGLFCDQLGSRELDGLLHELVVLIQSAPVEQSPTVFVAGFRLVEYAPRGHGQVSSAVVIGSLGLVANLYILQFVEVIVLEEVEELLIAALFQLLELLLCPHVEADRAHNAGLHAERTVQARAV